MAKISNNQPIVPFNPSDLKKVIVDRNKKLTKANKDLEAKIEVLKADHKEAEKDLRLLKVNCKDVFKELNSASDDLTIANIKLKSAKDRFKDTSENESRAYSSIEVLKEVVSSLTSESSSLSAKVADLNMKANASKGLSKTIASLKTDIEASLSEVKKLKASKSRYKNQSDNAAKTLNEMIVKNNEVQASLESSNESFKAELKIIDKKLSIARAQSGKDISQLEENVVESNLKLDEVDAMTIKAESEYLSWERKVSVAKNNVLEEEDRIEVIKKNFDIWKVDAVEEVARLKLRGKIEKIDKAGLKDVLN